MKELSSLYEEGKVWTDDSALRAYADGTLTGQEYEKIATAFSKEKNRRFGAIFMELLPIRRQIAVLAGYAPYSAQVSSAHYDLEEVMEDFLPCLEQMSDAAEPHVSFGKHD